MSLVSVGRLTGVYGIKGWFKLQSQTEPTSNIFNYQPWYLSGLTGGKPVELQHWKAQGKGFVVQLQGIDNRTDAEALLAAAKGRLDIAVEKSQLPVLDEGDYYWHQLEGCRVFSGYQRAEPVDLGRVVRIMPTGANDVLVVRGDQQSVDRRERLIPYIGNPVVRTIDLSRARIDVDWDPDF
ncbi:MAG: ribosome maturation factor RimM [Cellvibrionaceae bacterium]|nr:ribosome maturation factor RimM [Cellvibrionaceae bacterium]